MASRYWVGGTANWDATVGTKWAATSGGAGGQSVPTAADDVFFDAASGAGVATIPTATTVLARSVTCTGYTGTLTHTSSSAVLTIGDASGGALTLSAGMTYNPSTAALNFVSTSSNGGTGWTIITAGKTLGQPVFNGVGGKWVLGDALTTVNDGTLFVSAGTFDTAGFSVTADTFSYSSVGVRTVNLNSSTVTCRGLGSFAGTTTNNLTFNAGTSTIVVTPSGSGAFTAPVVSLYNVTLIGPATKTGLVALGADTTATGTVTITGNSLTNRLLVQSNSAGLKRTITAPTVSLSNADFTDIGGAGAAAPFTGTSLGDATGNSGITFTTPVTRYGVVAGNWSSTAMWSTTSGGAGGAAVPLPQDTVVFDASSAAGTYVMDMPRLCKDLTCTGFTRTLTLIGGANSPAIYGSLALSTGGTFTGGTAYTMSGRGTHTITSAGKTIPNIINFSGFGGTYTLLDALSTGSTNSGISVDTSCTLVTGGFSVTTNNLGTNSLGSITAGTSTFTLTATATSPTWSWSSTASGSMSSSTIVFSAASSTSRTFAGNGRTYGTLTYTVANSPGGLTITGANTFGTLNVGSGRTLTLPSSTTTLVTNWNVVGQNNGYVYLPGGSGNYMSAPDSAAVSITSDIDLRCRVALDSWTTGTSILLAKRSANAVGSYVLYMLAGVPHFIQFVGVAATDSGASIAATTPANGTAMWVRATWRQSDGRIQFFTAPGTLTNPVASDFTQVGTDRTGVTGSMPDTTDLLEIGSQLGGTAGNTAGKFYRAQVRNGLDGTVVFDADLVNKTFGANTFVESSTQAATVTLNGTAPVGDGRVFLNSSTGGTAAILLSDGPQILSAYLKIQDVAAGIVPAWNVSNLLPADTSTLEGSIGSWVASTGCTIARSTADFRDGAASLLVTPTTTGPKATNDATKIAITLGTLYVVSAYVKAATAGAAMTVYPYFWNSTPTYLADGVAVSRSDVTTAWTRIINGFVPSGTQAYASPAVNGVAVVGQAHYYDDIAMAATTSAYAGATSLSVSNTTGWLFTDMAVGAQIGTPWPVRTPVGAQRQGLWPARAVTGQSRQAAWPVRAAVGQQRQGLWPVRTPVASQRQGLWPVRATVASQRQALWPVRTVTSSQRAAVWPVRVKVGQQRQALWPTRTPVGSQRQALWSLLTNIRSDRQAPWPVRTPVGAQRQAVWSARALVTGQRQARWPVRVPVAKQGVIAWPIYSPVTRSLQASWLLTTQVASQRQVAWPLAAVVGKQTDLAWGVRVTVRNSRAVAWPITTRVTAECVLEWTMIISIGRTLAVRWPTRRTVGRDLMSMWSLGHLVACQLALVWRVFFGPHRDVDITVAAPELGWVFASPELGWTFDSPVLETAVGLPSVETVST